MKKAFVLAFAMAALAAGTFTQKNSTVQASQHVLLASGGSNCPVYYGCPPPPTGGNSGGVNSGGVNSGGVNSGGTSTGGTSTGSTSTGSKSTGGTA